MSCTPVIISIITRSIIKIMPQYYNRIHDVTALII
jgi:hypothetical protein